MKVCVRSDAYKDRGQDKRKTLKTRKIAGKDNKSISQGDIEKYIEEQDIGAYINDLWLRIGTKLKSKGVTTSQIRKAIRNYRRKDSESGD